MTRGTANNASTSSNSIGAFFREVQLFHMHIHDLQFVELMKNPKDMSHRLSVTGVGCKL